MPSRFSYFWLRSILLLLMFLPGLATAQTSASTNSFFDDQLWEFGAWGAEAVGKSAGQAFGDTQITMAGFHAGRAIHRSAPESGLRRTWEYTFEIEPLFLVTRPRHTYGGGFAPVGLKWNFAPRGRYRPFIEFNGGAMFTTRNVPPGNTSSFNFSCSGGTGVMMAVTHTQALSFGVRFWHLSNAYIGNDNPAFNTVQFVVGYHWMTRDRRRAQQLSQMPGAVEAKQ